MDCYVGEIRMFAGNFAPVGWVLCNGQLLSIAENDLLFMLLGTTYGGDGQTNFAVPDLRGRIPIHMGQNPTTGTTYSIGQKGGSETVTLTVDQLASHTHPVYATKQTGDLANPSNAVWATSNLNQFSDQGVVDTVMAADTVSPAGGGQAHDNMMPFLCVNYIIAAEGLFPSRS